MGYFRQTLIVTQEETKKGKFRNFRIFGGQVYLCRLCWILHVHERTEVGLKEILQTPDVYTVLY
jgi:hypothetical protein